MFPSFAISIHLRIVATRPRWKPPSPLHELATRLHIHAWLYRGHHAARCVLVGSVVGTSEFIDADPMKTASGLLDWYSKPGAAVGESWLWLQGTRQGLG